MQIRSFPALPAFTTEHGAHHVLSAYISVPPGTANVAAHVRAVMQHGLSSIAHALRTTSHAERADFEIAANLLLDRVHTLKAPGGEWTWVGFSSSGTMIDRVVPAALPVRNESIIKWATGPWISPLAALGVQREYLVVLADREHARFLRLGDDLITEVARFETKPRAEVGAHTSAPPQMSFHHGTHGAVGTDSAARQADVAHDRHRARIVDTVCDLAESAWILLGGASETVARVATELPPNLARRARLGCELQIGTTIPQMRKVVAAIDAELRASSDDSLVHHALATARATPNAVLGPGPTRIALSQHAVKDLVLSVHQLETAPLETEEAVRSAMALTARISFVRKSAAAMLDASAAGVAAELHFPVVSISTPSTQMA